MPQTTDMYAEMERVSAHYRELPDWVKPVLTSPASGSSSSVAPWAGQTDDDD